MRKVKLKTPLQKTAQHYFAEIYPRLSQHYAAAECALHYESVFQLLIATVLSAQCTDEQVNRATPTLFQHYPDSRAMAEAPLKHLESLVFTTGFYRNKAKSILNIAIQLRDHHQGQVPQTMEELLKLPGVARKTANVVLGVGYGRAAGIVVDTHVARITQRWQWTTQTKPHKIEQDLMQWLPQTAWLNLSHQIIAHGRALCKARNPLCDGCFLAKYCPYPSSMT
jgi:endonuclease-3